MTTSNGSQEPIPGTQLRHSTLGFGEVLFQGIGHIGPAVGLITSAPVIVIYAGGSMPFAFLLATVVALLVGNSVAQLARHLPSAGGYFTYVGRGLGPSWGYMTAWNYFLFDPLIVSVGTPLTTYYVQTAMQAAWGIFIPWQVMTVVVILGLGLVNYLGVREGLRATLVLGLSEIIVMLALGVILIAKGPHQYPAALTPQLSPTGLHGIAFGLIFSILSFAGFESVAPLAEETRRPRRNLPVAVFVSVLVGGLVFVVAGYGTVVGWGLSDIEKFPTAANPYYTLAAGVAPWAPIFVILALVNSTLAVNLASQNAATRVAYGMGRFRLLPSRFGAIHPRFRTPSFGIVAHTVLSLVLSLVLGTWLGPLNEFAFLGELVTLALILTYIMGNFAVSVYYWRERRSDANILLHFILPGLATLVLLAPLVASVYPLPPFPTNLPIIILPIWLIGGFFVNRWLRRNRPLALQSAARLIFNESDPAAGAAAGDTPAATS